MTRVLPQRIEGIRKLFCHGPAGKLTAQGAFAFEHLLQVEAHGAPGG